MQTNLRCLLTTQTKILLNGILCKNAGLCYNPVKLFADDNLKYWFKLQTCSKLWQIGN